jgi:hypothetical protein
MVAGCSQGQTGASPTAYVTSVCTAFGTWVHDIQSHSATLDASPSGRPVDAKAAIQGFLSIAVADTARLVHQLKTAGNPIVGNGKQIAAGLVSTFTRVQSEFGSAASAAASLPTGDPAMFRAERQTLAASIRQSLQNVSSSGLSGLRSPELEQASARARACTSLSA